METNIMKNQTSSQHQMFKKQYIVAIDTVPVADITAERVQIVVDQIMPVINQIVTDAMTVAIGTWPTPENQKTDQ